MRYAIVALLAACNSGDIVVGKLQEVAVMRAIPNRDLDLLFVIDNSPSMADKQLSLAENFPRMMDVLDELDGGLPNLHIGVITSDMGTQSAAGPPAPSIGQIGNGGCAGLGDDGALQHANAPELTGSFISDIANGGNRDRNYTGELRDVFSHLARVGAGGCGFEQHLAAMRRALVNPANAGFVRPAANLAVIVLADEDDYSVFDPSLFDPSNPSLGPLQSFRCFDFGVACDPDHPREVGDKTGCAPRPSAIVETVQPFVDALLAAKPDPRQIMVAGVVGDRSPVAVAMLPPPGGGAAIPTLAHSCQFSGPNGDEFADPAVRLGTFLDQFPGRSQLTSICNADLSTPLGMIGATAKKLVGDPCIDTTDLADISADPGVQPACEVTDVRDSAPDAPIALPVCDSVNNDCYELYADPGACPATQDHLRIRIERYQTTTPDTWTHVRCQRAS
jgi:hypothetical protein